MMTEYTITPAAAIARLNAIQTGTGPDGNSLLDEGEKPLYRRRLAPGALLAVRRFVKVLEGVREDAQAAQEVILEEAREALDEQGVTIEEGTLLPPEFVDRINQLFQEEITVMASPVPAEVLVEEGGLSMMDLDILAPIIAED